MEVKFRPRFLHEMVEDLYTDKAISNHKLQEILDDPNSRGTFWEKVLEKYMDHTKRLKAYAWHMDFDDGSDAKFAIASTTTGTNGSKQATINYENKTGPLRVCLVYVGAGFKYHRLFFMKIPYEYYSQLNNGNSPIKITFSNFQPIGEIWEKYQCKWEDVIAPITTVDKNEKVVYTDEYQYLLESLEA
jgi:hypothetical protein